MPSGRIRAGTAACSGRAEAAAAPGLMPRPLAATPLAESAGVTPAWTVPDTRRGRDAYARGAAA